MCEGCWGKSRVCQEEKALQAGSRTHKLPQKAIAW